MEYITTETHINFHNNCSKRKLTRVERLGHSVNPSGCWSLPYMPKSLDKIMNSRVPQSVKQCQHSPPKVPTAVPLWSRVQLAVVQEPKSVRGVSTCSPAHHGEPAAGAGDQHPEGILGGVELQIPHFHQRTQWLRRNLSVSLQLTDPGGRRWLSPGPVQRVHEGSCPPAS